MFQKRYLVFCLLVTSASARTIERSSENETAETSINKESLFGEREDVVLRIQRPDYCDVIEVVDAPSCGGGNNAYRYDSLTTSCVQYLKDNCSTSMNTFDTYETCVRICSRPDSITNQGDPEEKIPCNCDWSYFRHYAAKKCTPVYKEDSEDCRCPFRFECPQNLTRQADECRLNGKTYKIGEAVETSNPCSLCTCTADLISCITVECPTLMSPQLPPNCHHIYDPAPNDCCPKAVCYNSTNEEDLNEARCSYKDRSYLAGERIFPDEDPCLTCVCTANWTGVNNASCRYHDCMMENDLQELNRGCIPIYHENACCPVGYHCPSENSVNEDGLPKACLLHPEHGLCNAAFPRHFYNSTSGQCSEFVFGGCGGNQNNFDTLEDCEVICGSKRNEPLSSNFKDDKCYFDHWYYPLGADLAVKHDSNCVTCTCSVPPDFTCIHRSCPPPPNDDYVNCVFKYKLDACCPEYECTPASTACPHIDCSEPGCVLKKEPDGCGHCDCVSPCPPVVCAPGCSLEDAQDGRCQECVCNATRQSRETICPTPQCSSENCKIVDGPQGCPTCLCTHECTVRECEPGCDLVKDYMNETACPVCRCDSKNDIAQDPNTCVTPKCDKYCHPEKRENGCPMCVCEPLCIPPDCSCSEPRCELIRCEVQKEVPYGRCLGCDCPDTVNQEFKEITVK